MALLWPAIYRSGAEIAFGVQSFRWTNQAHGKAGVTCVIVGLSSNPPRERLLYTDSSRVTVSGITPYLTEGNTRTIVYRVPRSLFGLPTMVFGSRAIDDGGLILSAAERDVILAESPESARYMRRFIGSNELIQGTERFALWVTPQELARASAIPALRSRFERVAAFRRQSKNPATADKAKCPYRFAIIAHEDTSAIVVPIHSSERREYIPIGFVDAGTVISNAANAVYGAEPWLFGLLQSRMHMTWVRAVGGRLESRYRYSSVLVYNTFPVPRLTGEDRANLTVVAAGVLAAREQFPNLTLAELYDPEAMPNALREAHRTLDTKVEQLFAGTEIACEDDRLRLLFSRYADVSQASEGTHA